MAATAPTVTAAVDIWRERGPHQFGTLIGVSVGILANPAGQSVVYGFGGCDAAGGDLGHCTEDNISIYNVATDSWTSDDAASAAAVHKSNGVGAIGGKLYSSGGYTMQDAIDGFTNGAWAYDPVARQATKVASMPKRTAEGVTGVINGKLYVLPGLVDENLEQKPIRRLYRYDPATNKWGARRSAPHFHRLAAAGVIGGKFYVAGGLGSTDLDVYDPATDSWTTRTPIPKAGRAIGTALDGKLYVIVGLDAYVYNPATNKWSAIADPMWGHEGAVRVVINGKPKLLAVGGFRSLSGQDPTNTEVYTP
jgi:N-acetylneuraminic acid mutarotase